MENFEVDPTITHVFVKGVLINELLRDVAEIDAEILGAVQWSLKVEVSDVEDEAIGSLAREDTVDDKFEEIKRCSFGSHTA